MLLRLSTRSDTKLSLFVGMRMTNNEQQQQRAAATSEAAAAAK